MTKDAIKKQIRQAFDRRVAVRVYKDEEIPREDMEAILDTAWLSPSSIGLEGWRFVVLDRQHIKELAPELKEVAWGAQYQLDTASHFVLLLAEKADR
ncbi:nitroreductase family protein, partial [Streptococcus sobrinus]